LREAAADEPQAGLAGGRPHVAQLLLFLVDSPYRTDAFGNAVAEQLADEVFQAQVTGRQHDQIRAGRPAAAHPGSCRDECVDVRELHQADLALDDQVRAPDVEVVAPAALPVLELPTCLVLGIDLEAGARQVVEQRLVQFSRLLGHRAVGLLRQRQRHR